MRGAANARPASIAHAGAGTSALEAERLSDWCILAACTVALSGVP